MEPPLKLLLLIVLIASPPLAIAVDGPDRSAAETYDCWLGLIAGVGPSDVVRLPVSTMKDEGESCLWTMSWHVSPNESRGFEISVPKGLITIDGRHALVGPIGEPEITYRQQVMLVRLQAAPLGE